MNRSYEIIMRERNNFNFQTHDEEKTKAKKM